MALTLEARFLRFSIVVSVTLAGLMSCFTVPSAGAEDSQPGLNDDAQAGSTDDPVTASKDDPKAAGSE